MISMEAFADEVQKIAAAAEVLSKAKDIALPLAKKYWKPAALVGGGATGYHFGKKELDKYMLGRRMYERMQEG